jgi:hypothetical protein
LEDNLTNNTFLHYRAAERQNARIMRSTKLPARHEIAPDTPLRLSVAAALAFPDGSMTASGLRRECARGRLVVERIAGKDYTTLANIERMRELCRLAPDHTSISDARDLTRRETTRRSGSSKTEVISEARAALRTMLKVPNECSRNISPANTPEPRDKPATVIQMKSPSQTS